MRNLSKLTVRMQMLYSLHLLFSSLLFFLVSKLISKEENVRVLHSFLALRHILHWLFTPALLLLKNISTVFPRIRAECLFNGFWLK